MFSTEVREKRIRWLLPVLCAPLIAGGVALTSTPRREVVLTSHALSKVREASIVEIRDHRGRTVLNGEFRSRRDVLGGTEFDAALHDRTGRTVIGEVELEIPPAGRAHRQPELELDIIGLPAKENFTLVIDDRHVATFATDDRGSIDRELQEGEAPFAP